MKADWQDLDPALADLGEAIGEVMEGPTHVRTRSLVRALRAMPMEDVAQRLPEADRRDLQHVLEDVDDVLADTGNPNGTHMSDLVDQCHRALQDLHRRLGQAPEDQGVVQK
jgi:hypothetical protein